MIEEWLGTSPTELWLVVVSTIGIGVAAVVTIRVVGLRSLSKMSSFDFVVTVALGSVIGAVASSSASVSNGALAFATLLGLKWLLSTGRRRFGLNKLIDNDPILLMNGQTMLERNLDRAQVTRADVIGKLREANVTHPNQILAVVFEPTGDISVLHGRGPLDSMLLDGVRGQSL